MGAFQDNAGNELNLNEIADLTKLAAAADPAYANNVPEGWSFIDGSALPFSSSVTNGYISGAYFRGGVTASGAEATALLSDNGEIAISFRATNDAVDLLSYSLFANNRYLDVFSAYLTAIAQYAQANGYTIKYVAGASLGGAATNMLHEEALTRNGGAFADASYFAIATPVISGRDEGIVNFGFDNDWVYKAWERNGSDGTGGGDYQNSMDNLIYYNSTYHSTGWDGAERSSHTATAFGKGINAVANSEFYQQMDEDSLIVIGAWNSVSLQRALDRTEPDAADTYFVTAGGRDERVSGSNANDHVDLGDGNDRFWGRRGDDVAYGDSGSDRLFGYLGHDQLFGGWGADRLSGGVGNDYVDGGGGNDVLYGGNGRDQLVGGGGHDQLYGGRSNDILLGGWGNDILRGDRGADVFQFDGRGTDIVRDYEEGRDVVELVGDGSQNFNISNVGDDAHLTYAGGTLILLNMDADDVTIRFTDDAIG